jgi:hypothetical protein
VKGNQGIEMMLDVALHVHEEKAEEEVELQRAGVQTMVPHVLRKSDMLQPDEVPLKKTAVESWKPKEEHGKPTACCHSEPDNDEV